MGLVTPGVSGITSSQPSAIIANNEADVKDTFINRTAISPKRYNDIYGTLMGYAEGSPIVVEYYHRRAPVVNNQTSEVDYSIYRNNVHSDYLLIHNLEIILEDSIDMAYDEEQTNMEITGKAVMYPGLNPMIGDLFLYVLPDKQIGIFIVDNITRLSIRQATHHAITFRLVEYGDQALGNLEKLNASVSESVYFDKQKYLSNNATLLTSDSYIQLRDLKQLRGELVQYYFNNFFSNELNTIIHPDNIYDPYVVEFIHAKVSFMEVTNIPVQIYPEVTNFTSSIWFLLTGAVHSNIKSLKYQYFSIKDIGELWDVNFTGLLNRNMIYLNDTNTINAKKNLLVVDPNDDKAYVLSNFFYLENQELMSPFEKLLYKAIIDNKDIDIDIFINDYLKKYKELPPKEAFYNICLYIFLIDLAIAKIT